MRQTFFFFPLPYTRLIVSAMYLLGLVQCAVMTVFHFQHKFVQSKLVQTYPRPIMRNAKKHSLQRFMVWELFHILIFFKFFIYLFIYLFIYFFFYFIFLFFYLFIYLFIYLFMYLFIYLFIFFYFMLFYFILFFF